ALTCLFSLLYLGTLPVDGRSTARAHSLRIAWLVCALLSKESATLLPVVATMLCLATASAGDGADRARRAIRAAAGETWPSWVVLGAYLAWRARLFSSIWKVYLYSTPPQDLSELLGRLASFRFIVDQNIGEHVVLWTAAAIAALVAMLLIWQR